MLAVKVVERRTLRVSAKTFSRSLIVKFENDLLKVLNFRVTPLTYVNIAETLLYFWDGFIDERKLSP